MKKQKVIGKIGPLIAFLALSVLLVLFSVSTAKGQEPVETPFPTPVSNSATWNKIQTAEAFGSPIYDIVKSCENDNTIYASTINSIFVSKNLGASWSKIFDQNELFDQIFADDPEFSELPQIRQRLLAANCLYGENLFIGTDIGLIRYSPVSNEIKLIGEQHGLNSQIELSVLKNHPNDSQIMYLGTWGHGLYKTNVFV